MAGRCIRVDGCSGSVAGEVHRSKGFEIRGLDDDLEGSSGWARQRGGASYGENVGDVRQFGELTPVRAR